MGTSPHKQYHMKLPRDIANYFDKQCHKYQWAAPQTITVALGILERMQKVASVFHVGTTSDGSTMTVYRLPSGEVEVLQEEDALDLANWLLAEVNKGFIGCFCPEDPEHPGDSFLDTLQEYPENAIGSAMMAIDGLTPSDREVG